ncbi:MAG: hypothetical protein OIF38_16085 [Cellvibrionaceae bacterium]|nr:hypothetical protein [Cellvibrionaceae bacterium]
MSKLALVVTLSLALGGGLLPAHSAQAQQAQAPQAELLPAPELGPDHDPTGLTGKQRGTIHYVHLDRQQLVINDQIYIMPLNFKVSMADGRQVNRYALAEGQAISFVGRYDSDSDQYVVDKVTILE